MEYNEVKKQAEKLDLKLSIQTLSIGQFATIKDKKSNLSTKGNVFSKSPESIDFLNRLKELKSFINNNEVLRNNKKVIGFKK